MSPESRPHYLCSLQLSPHSDFLPFFHSLHLSPDRDQHTCLHSPPFAQREDPGPGALLCGSGLGSQLWGPPGTVTRAVGGSKLPGSALLGLGEDLAVPTRVPLLDGDQEKPRDGTGQTGSPCLPPANPGFPQPQPCRGAPTPSPPPAMRLPNPRSCYGKRLCLPACAPPLGQAARPSKLP